MKGILIDENLPKSLLISTPYPVIHAIELGSGISDSALWAYAEENQFVILTKDTDFFNRILFSQAPPWVVWVRYGNVKRKVLENRISSIWPEIERLLEGYKLVEIFKDNIQCYN